MLISVYFSTRMFAYKFEIHAAWASVLLVRNEGNARALKSGTATMQSRFFCVYDYNRRMPKIR